MHVETGHGHGPPPRARHWALRAGWVRAAWMTGFFFLLGLGIVVFFRWLGGYDPTLDWEPVIVVAGLTPYSFAEHGDL